jgi:hypothetical protein
MKSDRRILYTDGPTRDEHNLCFVSLDGYRRASHATDWPMSDDDDLHHGVPADRRPSDPHPIDHEGEALVLVAYAAAMHAVQQLEFALKHLAATKDEMPDGISPDAAWKRTLKVLLSPMGRLESIPPRDLADRLQRLRPIRNRLAHDLLLQWRIDTNLGLASHREVAEALIELEDEFVEIEQAISALADESMRLQGIKPEDVEIPAGEMRRMLSGLDQS